MVPQSLGGTPVSISGQTVGQHRQFGRCGANDGGLRIPPGICDEKTIVVLTTSGIPTAQRDSTNPTPLLRETVSEFPEDDRDHMSDTQSVDKRWTF